MRDPEEVGLVTQMCLLRRLFERCIKIDLGLEPREYFLTPSNADTVSLYIKEAIAGSMNSFILESRNGFQGITKFADIYKNLIDEVNRDFETIKMRMEANEHDN